MYTRTPHRKCSIPKLDFSHFICQRIQELEATLYNALQQETVIKFGELLSEKQQEELRTAVEKLRRQMLRKSREYDCQILQERMELLQQAHQVRMSDFRLGLVLSKWDSVPSTQCWVWRSPGLRHYFQSKVNHFCFLPTFR